MATYHAISTTKTWCGLEVDSGQESARERPLPLIAQDHKQVTCPACLEAMPGEQPTHVRSADVVKQRLDAERRRFDHRKGAPPEEEDEGIDPAEIAKKVALGLDS